ncbi:hypothetical protein MNV84_06332 [Leishmania braziliensis]|nr:hypothetical protein MNV84_06332 [Leishmania braziliensis]
MSLRASGSPQLSRPLEGRESPPPIISDSDSTPRLPSLYQRVLDGRSSPLSIRSATPNVSGISRSEDEMHSALRDPLRSSLSPHIVAFNSFSVLDSNSSPPPLILSEKTFSSISVNTSLYNGGRKGDALGAQQADSAISGCTGSQNLGAYVDHENWMSSSIELEAVDVRKVITVMKGKKQERCHAALSPVPAVVVSAEKSRLKQTEMPNPRRGMLPSGRKRSVSINAPPDTPRERQALITLRPRQAAAVVQQQQYVIRRPYMPTGGGLPTLRTLPGFTSAPYSMALRPVPPAVAVSRAHPLELSISTSSEVDNHPASSKSRERSAEIGTASWRRMFWVCGGSAKQVAPKNHA